MFHSGIGLFFNFNSFYYFYKCLYCIKHTWRPHFKRETSVRSFRWVVFYFIVLIVSFQCKFRDVRNMYRDRYIATWMENFSLSLRGRHCCAQPDSNLHTLPGYCLYIIVWSNAYCPFDIIRKDSFCLAFYFKWKYSVTTSYQKTFVFLCLFCFQIFTLKLNLRPKNVWPMQFL